jgi:hypothetical protein
VDWESGYSSGSTLTPEVHRWDQKESCRRWFDMTDCIVSVLSGPLGELKYSSRFEIVPEGPDPLSTGGLVTND